MIGDYKIISGGQTGADIAGLKSAKIHNLETGGYIPKGFLTLDGNKPEYQQLYNLIETKTTYYGDRTKLNVVNSDCTIWFGENKTSNGKICTFKNIKKYNKPHLDIDIKDMPKNSDVYLWISQNNFKIINIAGNSETTSNGIQKIVEIYLIELFDLFKKN
jgi:hypothetical protein